MPSPARASGDEPGRGAAHDSAARGIALVTLLVRDYDEAIGWFSEALGFALLEDRPLAGGKRWVVVAPHGARGAALLLARAADDEQRARIGDQTGGRVALFLETDDFHADHARMRARGVLFTEEPRAEPYGTVAVFRDLYGNRWDLLQRRPCVPWTIRPERAGDAAAVRAVHVAAFDTPAEADLVEALRERARPSVSLVAEDEGTVVGHVLFTPVTAQARPELCIMGLAPLAVLPERQRAGIGSALTRAGLAACRALGAQAVVVLGHARYYPRFGFAPARELGFSCAWDVPDEHFMALELVPGALAGAAGRVEYHAAFAEL